MESGFSEAKQKRSIPYGLSVFVMVGLVGLEPMTSTMSTDRSHIATQKYIKIGISHIETRLLKCSRFFVAKKRFFSVSSSKQKDEYYDQTIRTETRCQNR